MTVLNRSLQPALFLINTTYPTEFVSDEPRIYVNLADISYYPEKFTVDDVVYHTMRAILVETICFHLQASHNGWHPACQKDCGPHQIALKMISVIYNG